MQIEITKLKAARWMTSPRDVRYYLCGVHVGNGELRATNGHYAILIKDAGIEGAPNVIIPNDTLDIFFQELKKAKCKDAHAQLDQSSNLIEWILRAGSVTEMFKPVDGTFPDLDRAMPQPGWPIAPGNYNWEYLVTFNKAYRELGAGKYMQVELEQHGPKDGATVLFPGHDDAIGVLMTLRQ